MSDGVNEVYGGSGDDKITVNPVAQTLSSNQRKNASYTHETTAEGGSGGDRFVFKDGDETLQFNVMDFDSSEGDEIEFRDVKGSGGFLGLGVNINAFSDLDTTGNGVVNDNDRGWDLTSIDGEFGLLYSAKDGASLFLADVASLANSDLIIS